MQWYEVQNIYSCVNCLSYIIWYIFKNLIEFGLWKGTIFGYKGGKSKACFFGTQPVQDGWVKEPADKSLKRAVFDIHSALTRIHSALFTTKFTNFLNKWGWFQSFEKLVKWLYGKNGILAIVCWKPLLLWKCGIQKLVFSH